MNGIYRRRLRNAFITFALAALLLAGQARTYAVESTAVESTTVEPTTVEPSEIKAK